MLIEIVQSRQIWIMHHSEFKYIQIWDFSLYFEVMFHVSFVYEAILPFSGIFVKTGHLFTKDFYLGEHRTSSDGYLSSSV